jgi:hypothetical protein
MLKHPQLLMATEMNVGPDGRADLSSGAATFMFGEEGGGHPCSLIMSVTSVGVTSLPQDTCLPQTAVRAPTCSPARIAKKLGLSAKVKAQTLAYLNLGSLGVKWTATVNGESKLVDDDCD